MYTNQDTQVFNHSVMTMLSRISAQQDAIAAMLVLHMSGGSDDNLKILQENYERSVSEGTAQILRMWSELK